MLVHEERLVLQYLRQRNVCSLRQIVQNCWPGAPSAWAERILQQMEWLGYITVYPGGDGQPQIVQITNRGKEAV